MLRTVRVENSFCSVTFLDDFGVASGNPLYIKQKLAYVKRTMLLIASLAV